MPSNANNGSLKAMAWVKAIIALVFGGVIAYLAVTGMGDTEKILALISAILLGYFGFSSQLYRATANDQKREITRQVNAIVDERLRRDSEARRRRRNS